MTHDVPWVIKHFRPLLDKINLDSIPEEPCYQEILLSDEKQYIRMGMEDCVLTVCRRNFKSTANGFYTFSHQEYEGQTLFFLNIYINNSLFVSNNPELRIKRRRAIVHEFTHCVAAFLSIGRIKTQKLVDNLIKDLINRVKVNAQIHYQSLLIQFGNSSSAVTNALEIYPDEHFRLGYEEFDHSFSTVYKELILDITIFEKYFTGALQNDFYKAVQGGDMVKAVTILVNVHSMLISEETISADFINLRLREELIEYYYQKAVS
jgi:hypothetical protein